MKTITRLSLIAAFAAIFTACGPDTTININNPPPGGGGGSNKGEKPTCGFTSLHTFNQYDSLVLHLTTNNDPDSARVDGIGMLDPAGDSVTVWPNKDTTYTGWVKNESGIGVCSEHVTMVSRKPSGTFVASPKSIPGDSSSTLTWSIADADSVFVNDIKMDSTSGSMKVKPSSTTTYLLRAVSKGGTVMYSVAVTVYYPTPLASINLSTYSIRKGSTDSVAMYWNSTGGISATLAKGGGIPVSVQPNSSMMVLSDSTTTWTFRVVGHNSTVAQSTTTLVVIDSSGAHP